MNAKKLGFGLMRLPLTDPNNESSVDIELLKKLADMFLARGFTYFDTAPVYCGGMSEAAFKPCVAERYPRDAYTLTTKLSPFSLRKKEDAAALFDLQLRRTGAGFFDYYWLHNINPMTIGIFDRFGCWDFIKEKKEEGLIRHIGFSFHSTPEMLEQILTEHPEMEYVQIQLNYLDWNSITIRSRECYEVAERFGKPVIVMEPVKGGSLAKVPEELAAEFERRSPGSSPASWAIRFAASHKNVVMVLSGMNSLAQMEDNTSYMDSFVPLNAEELTFMEQAADIINKNILVPCTGCSYCTDGCPRNIAIPKYFSLLNAEYQEKGVEGWTPQRNYYWNLITEFGKASDCIKCGQCERKCPQHLPIRKHLETVVEYFE